MRNIVAGLQETRQKQSFCSGHHGRSTEDLSGALLLEQMSEDLSEGSAMKG